jgi:hypothetical protein
MLAKLTAVPTEQEVRSYAQLLIEADTLADTVVVEVFGKLGFHQASVLIEEALDRGIEHVPDAPDCLRRLFEEANTTPDWLDENLLKAGSAFCRRTGSLGLTVLRNYCLMGGYESSAINKPSLIPARSKKAQPRGWQRP